jgi:hypothetical protein
MAAKAAVDVHRRSGLARDKQLCTHTAVSTRLVDRPVFKINLKVTGFMLLSRL